MDNQFRVSRLMRIFARHGGRETDRVKPFQAFTDSVRASLTSAGNLSSDECPFLAFYEGPSKWTVLTLSRVVWKRNDRVAAISINELNYPDLSDDDLASMRAAL